MHLKYLVTLILIIMVVTACSSSEVRIIEEGIEGYVMLIENGTLIYDGLFEKKELQQVIDFHNNATYVSSLNKDQLTEPDPLEEELSGSTFNIVMDEFRKVTLEYQANDLFKVIYEEEQKGYTIRSEDLYIFLKIVKATETSKSDGN
ncbi:hypothetical protein IM538_03930 [Cytobacillus suaedae]|nr:hypothetical protein IM538_03930 [Cytobacillus suaedae]